MDPSSQADKQNYLYTALGKHNANEFASGLLLCSVMDDLSPNAQNGDVNSMLQLMCRTRARLLQMYKGPVQEANPAVISILSINYSIDPSFDMDMHKYYSEQPSYPSIALTDPAQMQPSFLSNDHDEMPYEKLYMCTVPKCGKACRSKSSWRKHLETHTEEERAMILPSHFDGDSTEKRKKAGEAEYESYLCKFEGCNKPFHTKQVGEGRR